jgi:hypothetical protein
MNESTGTLSTPAFVINDLKADYRAEKKACEKYSFFLRSAWQILEPTTPLVWNWHYDIICDELQKQIERIAARIPKEYDLIFNEPPRSGKSTKVSRFLLPYAWTRFPSMRFITASYDSGLALDHAVDSRTIIQSPWYQMHWGDVFQMTGDQNVKSNYRNSESGYRITTSVGASGTGSGGQISVLDDPLDRSKGATSQATREEAIRWYRQTWYGCLNNKKIDLRILVMQRIHEEDPTGFLLKYFPGDNKLYCFPGELTDDVSPPEYKSRYVNGLFFPTNFSQPILDDYKKVLGSDYAGQILQRPTAPEGNKFKRHWFKFWRPKGSNLPNISMKIGTENYTCESRDLPDDLRDYINSWDFGLKPKTENDPTCGDVFARNDTDVFWLDEDHGHYDPFDKEAHAIALKRKHPKTSISIIEDETGGSETLIRLQKKYPGFIGKTPTGSKWSRADNAAALARSGHLWLPHPAIFPAVWDIIDELCLFDRGAHDERVDTLSQAVNYYNVMQRIWSDYDGKIYNFKTLWEAIERDTNPIIAHWVDKNLNYSCLISLWNSRTKKLWVLAEYHATTTLADTICLTIKAMLKLIFKDNADGWDLNKYLHFGSPLMFNKATGNVAEGFNKQGIGLIQIRYDERGSILRMADLFFRKSVIMHARCFELKEKIMSWTMDDNEKNPEPEITGYGPCRALCLTGAAIWESGFMKTPVQKRKSYYHDRKTPIQGNINDWMKII